MFELMKKIIVEARVALYLAISESAFMNVYNFAGCNDEQYKYGREALDKCWRWVEHGNVLAIDIYKLIDDPECESAYEYGMAEQEYRKKVMWYCLADAFAYTNWQAFNKEGIKYLPQIIEGINEEGFNDYIKDVVEQKLVNLNAVDNLIKYLHEQYSVNNSLSDKIVKEKIMNRLQEKDYY